MITASAPGKVILFGEHSVVYNKLGLAAAINRRIYTTVSANGDGFVIDFPFGGFEYSKEDIIDTYSRFIKCYLEQNVEQMKKFDYIDGMKIIIGELLKRFGNFTLNIKVKYGKNIKGIGTSAGVYSSTILAIVKYLGKQITTEELLHIASLGEMASHGGKASGIDGSAIVNGGIIKFRKSEGMEIVNIDPEELEKCPLIVVSSGESAKTSSMVAKVADFRNSEPDKVNYILDQMNEVAENALSVIQSSENKHNRLKKLGELMNQNHSLLKDLGVSTPTIDNIVETALENNALGAKITGGGGGGCAIILASSKENATTLVNKFTSDGFVCFAAELGCEGVKEDEQFSFKDR
jgi:mevalonate kinase